MHRFSPLILLWALAAVLFVGALAVLFPGQDAPRRAFVFDGIQIPYILLAFLMLALAALFIVLGKLAGGRR